MIDTFHNRVALIGSATLGVGIGAGVAYEASQLGGFAALQVLAPAILVLMGFLAFTFLPEDTARRESS